MISVLTNERYSATMKLQRDLRNNKTVYSIYRVD